jgi:hypothetical protein
LYKRFFVIFVSHRDFVRSRLSALHAAGLAVIPWTVNDEASMRRTIALGVDGFSSNYPEMLAQSCIRGRPIALSRMYRAALQGVGM